MPDSSQSRPAFPQQPPYYYSKPKKSRWWIPVVIILVVLFVIILGFIITAATLGGLFKKEPFTVKDNSVLVIKLDQITPDYSQQNPLAIFGVESNTSLWDLISAIKRAKEDNRIKGIYYRAGSGSIGMAMSQEYIEAIEEFKKSGKFVYSYVESASESSYMLALPSQKIFMSSEGMCELNGMGGSAIFYKGLLEKIGVDFYVKGFEDFKSAGESYSRKNFSDSARHQLRVLLDERFDYYLDLIAKYRNIDRDQARALLNEGVYASEDFLENKLIDSLASESTVKEILKDLCWKDVIRSNGDAKLNMVSVEEYMTSDQQMHQTDAPKDKQIAIIFASGAISDDQGKATVNSGITPTQFIKSLKSARENEDIKAIIIRVNSPGGSVLASESIREEIEKTRKMKPVYCSMSDVAASGGYYIAMACDTIIAGPHTITGSIGVISMFPNFSKLLGKLDVTVDTISSGEASQDLNFMIPFRDRQIDKINSLMEKTYKRFVQKVADSRKKDFDEARSLAKGRVWSGADAKERGLVDTMGGIMTAIDIAKRRIGLADGQKVLVHTYPEPEDEFALLMKLFRHNAVATNDYASIGEFYGLDRSQVLGLFGSLPVEVREELVYQFQLAAIARKEMVLAATPNLYGLK